MTAEPDDYTLLIPPGWWRIPLGEGRDRSIRELLDEKLAGLPPDSAGPFRHELEREVVAAARRADDAGGLELYLSVDTIRGMPVPASCVVSLVPPPPDGAAVPPEVLAESLGDDEDEDEVTLEEVAGAPAIRIRSRSEARPDEQLGNTLPVTRVDYFVPVPASAGSYLLLSFSTVLDPVVDALVTLFDAIAGSLRWRWT